MTDKTFTFTIDQVKAIYEAGIRRGTDEQSAYDWGCYTSGGKYSELVDAIYDIVNETKQWGAPDYTDWSTIKEWID